MSDLIKKLQDLGYQFDLGRDYEGAEDFGIGVKDPTGKDVARTILRPKDNGTFSTHPFQQVFVDPEHRRKGIASAMYEFAENQTGMKATPAETQNALGKSLWDNPNRTFGEKTNKFSNIKRKISQDELSDDQINAFIKEFEGLDESSKQSRRLGAGADAIAYDIPDSNYVLKAPNTEKPYNLSSLENNYLYSKQLGQHAPVEQPILIKRPESNDLLIQRKINTLDNVPESPTDEFYESAYDNNPTPEARKNAIKLERKRIDTLPENKAYSDYLKQLDNVGILEGDIHRGNVGIDSAGNTKTFDAGKFWLDEDLAKTKMKNEGLSKMRDTFSDNMGKLKSQKIFRSILGPVAGLGITAAMMPDNASAADFIPGLDQAESLGDPLEDQMIMAEVKARQNYDKSPAHFDRLKSLLKNK